MNIVLFFFLIYTINFFYRIEYNKAIFGGVLTDLFFLRLRGEYL